MTTPAPTPMNMPGAQQAAAAQQGQQPPAAGPGTPAPVEVQPTGGAPAAGEPAGQAPKAAVPPWGSDEQFDPQRAWNLIQNVRGDNEQLKQQLASAQPILDEHERLRQASLSDNERLTEQLAQSNSRGDTWRTQAVSATVAAMAAGRFVDTETALALIGDVSGFVDGDTIDATKISAALEKLATDKPFLVATPPPGGLTPNRAQGQSGAGPATASQTAAHAEAQQDWRTANTAKAQQLLDLRKQL